MYGEFELAQMGESSGLLGIVTLWLYVLISNVLLVNLLIAMMSDTYQAIKLNADTEWKFERVSAVLEAIERTYAVPPPFSLPILGLKFGWWLLGRFVCLVCCCACLLPPGSNSPLVSSRSQDRDEDPEWERGGRLWLLKRERVRIARVILQNHLRSAELSEDKSSDGRLRRIETLVEELLIFGEEHERAIGFLGESLAEARGGAPAARPPNNRGGQAAAALGAARGGGGGGAGPVRRDGKKAAGGGGAARAASPPMSPPPPAPPPEDPPARPGDLAQFI